MSLELSLSKNYVQYLKIKIYVYVIDKIMPQFMYRTRRRRTAKNFVKMQRRFKKKRNKQATLNKKVYKLINASKTYKDMYLNIAPSASGFIQDLGLVTIIEGTGTGDRQGEKIELKSINIKTFCYVLNTALANADAYNNVRIILFSLPQPVVAGVGLNVTDIIQDLDVLSHYKKDSPVKYTIHHDVLYYLDNQQLGGTPRWNSNVTHQKRYFKKLNFPAGLPVTYNSGGDVIKNNVMMLAISDSGIVPHPTIEGRIRLVFQP